jgi:diguanylate cyclase (GGDEF)-like protein
VQARETAGITTRLIIEETRRWGGDQAVLRLLELAGEPGRLDELSDERSWFSYETKIALFEAAAELTGEPHIARHMGAALLRSRIGRTLLLMLTLLGSPAQLLRSIDRASAKFNTVGDMKLLAHGRRSATISYRLHPGYRPNRHDCDLNIGLLSHVSAIYGLPPATITHTHCQIDGAGECVYQLTWRPRRRRRRNTPPVADVLEVQARFSALQQTVADLVGATDLETVLPAIARRASDAVQAERYLVVVQLDDEPAPRVYSDGFSPDQASQTGRLLLDGDDLPSETGSVLCAELKSARRRHGVLAAFVDDRFGFLDSEHELLESYARLGASALDSATAVAAARQGRQTAEVLLDVARRLLVTEGSAAVARLTAEATQSIGGCDRAAVWLWNEDSAVMTLAGQAGWPAEQVRQMRSLVISPSSMPELARRLANPTEPRFYDVNTAEPHVRHLIEAFDCEAIGVIPMATPAHLHGVVIAAWLRGGTFPPTAAPPFARLAGIADQATAALQRAALLDRVQWQASKDELTGLTNRRYFSLLLEETLQQLTETTTAGLLFLDLDRFKHVNDTLGHSAGDLLLQAVARRLQTCVRTDDVVARLGGDEFTVLLPAGRGSEEMSAVADKILNAFAEPIDVAGHPLLVRPSIGGVVLTGDRTDPTELLREADVAMYSAKRAGGGRMVVYEEAYDSGVSQAVLEAELHHAIVAEELSVAYQPQVDLWSGAAVGAEALVRWHHPVHGTLLPEDFLPLAEETGLIIALDLLVLRRAVEAAVAWRRGGRALRVAVNVSVRTLADEQLIPTIVGLLAETGFPPDALELELTESSAFADPDRVATAISALRDHGVSLALDDLGGGLNALRRVQQLPVGRLKIDGSFVADLPSGGAGAHLVHAVIGLGKRMGIAVIAEGVETPEQADALRAVGCREAQGFLFGNPTEPSELPFVCQVESNA